MDTPLRRLHLIRPASRATFPSRGRLLAGSLRAVACALPGLRPSSASQTAHFVCRERGRCSKFGLFPRAARFGSYASAKLAAVNAPSRAQGVREDGKTKKSTRSAARAQHADAKHRFSARLTTRFPLCLKMKTPPDYFSITWRKLFEKEPKPVRR